MCTGRMDLAFIFRALMNKKDGVFIGGCWPGECHYITEGNYIALSTMLLARKLLEMIGLDPQRVRLEWISASEGSRYAEVMNDFSKTIRNAGPIGTGEGIDPDVLEGRLDTLVNMIPYIKLVERERFRVPVKSVDGYTDFFASDAFHRMFKDLIADKFEISQMMALLRQRPCTPAEMSGILGFDQPDISRHLAVAARQGMCRYDESQNLYTAAFNDSDDKAVQKLSATVKTKALSNEKIDKLLDEHAGSPGSLIHVLMEIQEENKWIPKEILSRISEKLSVPLNRVMQVASFYKIFSLTPKGRHEIHVCTGTSCHLRGATRLMHSLEELTGVKAGHTDADATLTLSHGNCLGCCTLGPEIIVDGKHHGRVTQETAKEVLKTYE